MISLEGQVAIVTGAGRGIGRDTALALAKRGARVVVNDYGGEGDTITPGSVSVAESVVEEIKAVGGDAVADGSSVGTSESASTIVRRAMDAFGRVDILVNNAGGSLGIVEIDEDTDEQMEGVVRTNLHGPYHLIRHLWPIMKGQNYGRIVNLMSGAMMGMVGTAAYSAGKSGLIGLTHTAAIEGEPHNILVNGVWPVAFTRLAGKLKDPGMYEWMQQFPSNLVAEGIVFLSSPLLKTTGDMFTIGGGSVSRNAIFSNVGYHDPQLTAESLAEHFDEALDLTHATPLGRTKTISPEKA